MNRPLFLAAAALLLTAAPALAQFPECFRNEDWAVAVSPFADEPGAEFIVTPVEFAGPEFEFNVTPGDTVDVSTICAAEKLPESFTIGSRGDPLWYSGLAGQYLVLTRSTGPDGDVVIYDLENPAEPVVDAPYSSAVPLEVGDTEVAYWTRVSEGTAETCADYAEWEANGLGAAIYAKTVFDVASGQETASGETTCYATQ